MNLMERDFRRDATDGLKATPREVEIEQSFLGSLLKAEYGFSTSHLVERLTPSDFAIDVHQVIFGAITTLARQDQAPTFRLLAPLLEGAMATPSKTAVAYLGNLLSVAAPEAHVSGYAKAISASSARRQLGHLASCALESAKDPNCDVPLQISDMMDRLDAASATLRDRRPSVSSFGRGAAEVVAGLAIGPKDLIKTGLSDLDRLLCGWHRKELTIIAARPGMGKSAFLFSSFLSAAKQGTSSLIFSMEMPTEMVVKRMLSDAVWNELTPIPYEMFTRRVLDQHLRYRLQEAAARHEQLPITIDDQVGLTVSEIRTRTKRHIERLDASGQRLDCVIIDHLGKMRANDRYAGNKVHETGEKTNALAEMAKELDIAVVCAHQLNRGPENRDIKRPNLADLRDSGDVEQDAETVLFLYREAYYLQQRGESKSSEDGGKKEKKMTEEERRILLDECKNDLEVIIAKNRNGPCATADLFIDIGSNAVRNGSDYA